MDAKICQPSYNQYSTLTLAVRVIFYDMGAAAEQSEMDYQINDYEITNYQYDTASHEYAIYPESNLVAKQAGPTFKPLMYKQYWLLKMRAVLDDVTICPDSRILCVFRTNIQREGGSESVYFYGSYPLR